MTANDRPANMPASGAVDPVLINRPIVAGPRGVKLCRPSELVLDVLERPLREDFVKEDGEIVKAEGEAC